MLYFIICCFLSSTLASSFYLEIRSVGYDITMYHRKPSAYLAGVDGCNRGEGKKIVGEVLYSENTRLAFSATSSYACARVCVCVYVHTHSHRQTCSDAPAPNASILLSV